MSLRPESALTVPPGLIFFFQQLPHHDLEQEWRSIDPRLQAVLVLAAGISLSWSVRPTITTLWRSRQEQEALYKDGRRSVHEFGRAADLRATTQAYGIRMAETLNAVVLFDPSRPALKVATYEPDQGFGAHLHVQVPSGRTLTFRHSG